MLNELEQKLRNKFDVDPKTLPFLETLAARSTIVDFKPLSRRVCRDADDDNVLATAVAGNAAIILTGDKDLLVRQEFQGIKIISPRQFVEWLDRTATRPKR
jgi:putative PIN family toxin of toxin-antitoxin system